MFVCLQNHCGQSTRGFELCGLKREDKGLTNKSTFDPEKHVGAYFPVRLKDQTVRDLLQSLLMGASVFAYMAIDSLPGNKF